MKQCKLSTVVLFILLFSQPIHLFAKTVTPTQPAKTDLPPNIVFLMTDDQRWDTIGSYGSKDAITPNVDRLAAQGVSFDNAYHAVAICMPSRATIFTGRYFSDHRVGFTYPYNRTLPAQGFAQSYPAQMKEAGYRTGFIGKFGTRLESLPETVAEHFDFYAGISTTSKKGPHFPKSDKKLAHIYRKDRDPKERTLIKGDAMIRFLETQPKGQPFSLSVSFDAVKNDRDTDMYGPHVELFKDKVMQVPDNWVEGKNEKLPKVLDYSRSTYFHMKRTSTPALYQKLARRFAVQSYSVDEQVRRLVAKLEEMDVLDNTIIIYTSDNGRYHGSRGLYDKAIQYDEAIKQPLIVFDGRANKANQGRRIDAMVSSADLAPTILSLAGLDIPAVMKGADLTPLMNGTQDMTKWRDAVLTENFFIQELLRTKGKNVKAMNNDVIKNNRSYRSRGIRTKQYQYFEYFEHTPVIEELYELATDPDEQNNLVSDQNYKSTLAEMRKKAAELYEEVLQ